MIKTDAAVFELASVKWSLKYSTWVPAGNTDQSAICWATLW